MQAIVFEVLTEWQKLNNLSSHQGYYANRVTELSKWHRMLSDISLYKNNEIDYQISIDSFYINLKLSIAGLILLIDDAIDNANQEELIKLISLIECKKSSTKLKLKESLFESNMYYFFDLLDKLNFYYKSELAIWSNVKNLFFTKLIEEAKLLSTIHTNKISFIKRLKSCGLQGGEVSVYIDKLRHSILNTVNEENYKNIGENISKLFSIINAEKTTETEIFNNEIYSPTLILAFELNNLPIEITPETYNMYKKTSISREFQQIIQETKKEIIDNLSEKMTIEEIDFKRFRKAVMKVYI
jgi:hypothetical protein